MTLHDLLKHPSVQDVIVTADAIYLVLSGTGKPPLVYADKPVITVKHEALLASEHLPAIIQGESLRTGPLMERHGYAAYRLYEISTGKHTPSERQAIAHQLYGTGGRKSLVAALGGRRVGRSAFLVPDHATEKLELWLKEHVVPFSAQHLLLEVDA